MGTVDYIIVFVIVTVAVVYTGRALYRAVAGRKTSLGCDDVCPASKQCDKTNGDCHEAPRVDVAKGR
jgi:hypothetical protein